MSRGRGCQRSPDSSEGIDGLCQVQLLLTAAPAVTLAFLLADRRTNRRGICWAVTLVVGLSATTFIYSTECYPEFPRLWRCWPACWWRPNDTDCRQWMDCM